MRRSLTVFASAAIAFGWVVVRGGGIDQVVSLARGAKHLVNRHGKEVLTSYPETALTSATGPLERYGYGEIQVKAFVADHRVQKIEVVRFAAADTYSVLVEQDAVPKLDAEVLRANGFPIRVVSGATYTTEGYALSLQGALDRLRKK